MTATEVPQSQRDVILDNALALMSAHGAAGMSMRELAKACNLQVAAIYHYFDSKAALLTAVVAERQYGERLQEPLEINPEDPPADRLRAVFAIVWNGALEEEAIWRLILGEGLRGETAVLPMGRELLNLVELATEAWIREFVPEVEDPKSASALIVGQLLSGFVRRIFLPEDDQIGEELAAGVASTLLPS